MTAKESADQEVAANNAIDDMSTEDQAAENIAENLWVIEGVESPLTPLQFHYLSLLKRLIALKNDYQTDPSYEKWMMDAINKSSTYISLLRKDPDLQRLKKSLPLK
ncbi:MAG: hypothetical protein IIC23_10420 [Chloroflexi bacterium]|nr:hypothetical protein [Chloroflexota bacterium]